MNRKPSEKSILRIELTTKLHKRDKNLKKILLIDYEGIDTEDKDEKSNQVRCEIRLK